MSTSLQTLLSMHVLIGLVGVIAFCAVWMNLLKRMPPLRFLRWASFVGFASFFTSWFTGGYYYVIHYGKAVKPLIIKGAYPWAHTLFMEAKEHVFLFLPFLGIAVFAALLVLGERLEAEPNIKRALALLAGVTAILGIIVTVSGVIISGAVR